MSVRLPERVGRARAQNMAFTGRRVSGTEALRIGLADYCVADGDLAGATARLAEQITGNSWGTNRMTKALYADQAAMTRDGALAYERTRPYGLPGDPPRSRG